MEEFIFQKQTPNIYRVNKPYKLPYIIKLNNIEYNFLITLEIVTDTSNKKDHVRISNIKKINIENNEESKITFNQEISHIWPYLNETLFLLNKDLIYQSKKDPCLFYNEILNLKSDPNKIIIPYNNITKNDIEELIENYTNNEGTLEFYKITLIYQLNQFRNELINLLNDLETHENEFQKLLMKNKELFPWLLGIFDIKINEEIFINQQSKSGKKNRVDILTNKFVIELKKHTTKLFSKTKNRNNISSMSMDLSNAISQLWLYIFELNSDKNFNEEEIRKGILIIGDSKELDTFDNKNSWKLIKANSNIEILTYTELLKKVEILINSFENNTIINNDDYSYQNIEN